jgi:hypothetical protein
LPLVVGKRSRRVVSGNFWAEASGREAEASRKRKSENREVIRIRFRMKTDDQTAVEPRGCNRDLLAAV